MNLGTGWIFEIDVDERISFLSLVKIGSSVNYHGVSGE
jgi:hypothetical protein